MSLSDELQRLVPNACEEVLSSIGFRAKGSSFGDVTGVLARPQEYAAGMTDFFGEAMTGKLVLVSTFDFFAKSGPNRCTPLNIESARDWIRVRDWTMELSNQLVGRVKNRLCTLGVSLDTRLPKAASGHALTVIVRERKRPPILFIAGGHDVRVWFEATVNEQAGRGPRVDPLGEGDVVCF